MTAEEIAHQYAHCFHDDGSLAKQLAEDIATALRAAEERAEKAERALLPFSRIALVRDHDPNGPDAIDAPDLAITPAQIRAARAALAGSAPE